MNHCDSDDGDGGGEDQEASSLPRSTKVENALTSFREQWQRELEISPKRDPSKVQSSNAVNEDVSNDDVSSIETKAKNLFLKGVEHEQSGKLYEAIQFYKRAVQLVPDIEFRLYESSKMMKSKDKVDSDDEVDVLDNDKRIVDFDDSHDEQDNDDDEESDLFIKLSRIVNQNQYVCLPKIKQSTTHISALPMEIVLYILRWVVSSELDLRSLEMFSRVCRGFYVSARDSEIWKLACVRVWGVNCGTFLPKYQSWRDMYLQRPRLRYNGCYISKTSYIRHGENSYQDLFYRPWHMVEYYRYLRFFPEGKALMLTSTDDAQNCVNALKYRTPRLPTVLTGHYRLHDNFVSLVLKKQTKMLSPQDIRNHTMFRRRRREPVYEYGEQTFHVEFEIQNHHKRANSQLAWLRYTIFTKHPNGQEGIMCLKDPCVNTANIGGRYPPFKFSRVKSYSVESKAPLQ